MKNPASKLLCFVAAMLVLLLALAWHEHQKASQILDATRAEKKQYCLGVASILGDLKNIARDQDISSAHAGVLHMVQYCVGVEGVEDGLVWTRVGKKAEAIQAAISALQVQVLDATR